MKKVTYIITLIIAMTILAGQVTFATVRKEQTTDSKDQIILRLLFYPALEAVEKHYGELRQFWEDELLSIRKVSGSSDYEVVMQVETFKGAHNPPYGLDTMTFYIRYGQAELKNFEHRDE